jgi:hypothetical protein
MNGKVYNSLEEEEENTIIQILRNDRHLLVDKIMRGVDPLLSKKIKLKCFPRITSLYLGSSKNTIGFALENEIATITKELGIRLITDSPHNLKGLHILPIKHSKAVVPFPQDCLEFSQDTIHISYIPKNSRTLYRLREIIAKGRMERNSALYHHASSHHLQGAWKINMRTALAIQKTYRKAIQLADALAVKLKMQLTCTEGGNVLSGTRNKAPCIIVGRDTVDLNRFLLAENLNEIYETNIFSEKNFTKDVMKNLFAHDFGVNAKNVIFVEQPGDFHLDMHLLFISDNTVILNDATQTTDDEFQLYCKKQSNYSEEFWVKLKAEAKIKSYFERKVKKDLKKAGFNVISYPCVYSQPAKRISRESSSVMCFNFCNTILGTNQNNQKFIIAMGCPPSYQEKFKTMLQLAGLNSEEMLIYFLDLESSMECLYHEGGIACKTKYI